EDIAFRREVRAVPPEPVASLRRVDFTQRRFALLPGKGRQLSLEKIARFAEQVPRAVFLLVADPDVEVAADPRARVERFHRTFRRAAPEVVLDGATLQPSRTL